MRSIISAVTTVALFASVTTSGDLIPGFVSATHFDEQQVELRVADGIRVLINAPSAAAFDAQRSTHFVFYALPNGNTIEQTLGCRARDGLHWRHQIQHIGAQTRLLRTVTPTQNTVLLLLEADGLSWPRWRAARADAGERIVRLIDDLVRLVPHDVRRREITLTGHSGGGSFTTGLLNAGDVIPDGITRIAYLDSNYSYSNEDGHGEKIDAWLRGDDRRRLVVLAYDDREIQLDGKKVVGPTGGTWRATHRMLAHFGKTEALSQKRQGELDTWLTENGQAIFLIHPNPDNKILHTRLVGDFSGFLFSLTYGKRHAGTWGELGGPVRYTDWIQSTPTTRRDSSRPLPFVNRSEGASRGTTWMTSLANLDFDRQQHEIEQAFRSGNVPEDLRRMSAVLIAGPGKEGKRVSVLLHVARDYLAVGSAGDAVRVPMAPATAQRIADGLDCMLPTSRLVDAIHAAARYKLAPRPMGEPRTAIVTFLEHDRLVHGQLRNRLGVDLVAGTKKDVVLSMGLRKRPDHVAIYGWHHPDGQVIQPLTTVHGAHYVDYSHGVRLVARDASVNGRPTRVDVLLRDVSLAPLLSDEGTETPLRYPDR